MCDTLNLTVPAIPIKCEGVHCHKWLTAPNRDEKTETLILPGQVEVSNFCSFKPFAVLQIRLTTVKAIYYGFVVDPLYNRSKYGF